MCNNPDGIYRELKQAIVQLAYNSYLLLGNILPMPSYIFLDMYLEIVTLGFL